MNEREQVLMKAAADRLRPLRPEPGSVWIGEGQTVTVSGWSQRWDMVVAENGQGASVLVPLERFGTRLQPAEATGHSPRD